MTTSEILRASGDTAPWQIALLSVLFVCLGPALVSTARAFLRPAKDAGAKTKVITATLSAALLAACGLSLFFHHDRQSTAAADAKDHFSYMYGLKLTDDDIRELRDVDEKDITLRPDTGHGSDQDIQFRSVDGEVLPFHQATDEWEAVPVTAKATADADAKAEAEAEQEVIEVPVENGDSQ